jgi:hypothetical protein
VSAQVDNAPLLLEALAPLAGLRHLDLRGIYRTVAGRVAEPAALALALADKQHLSYLDLGQNRIYERNAAAGPDLTFGAALITPSWQLPALQVRYCLLRCFY